MGGWCRLGVCVGCGDGAALEQAGSTVPRGANAAPEACAVQRAAGAWADCHAIDAIAALRAYLYCWPAGRGAALCLGCLRLMVAARMIFRK